MGYQQIQEQSLSNQAGTTNDKRFSGARKYQSSWQHLVPLRNNRDKSEPTGKRGVRGEIKWTEKGKNRGKVGYGNQGERKKGKEKKRKDAKKDGEWKVQKRGSVSKE